MLTHNRRTVKSFLGYSGNVVPPLDGSEMHRRFRRLRTPNLGAFPGAVKMIMLFFLNGASNA